MKRYKSATLFGGILLASLGVANVFAADGIIEINQAAADAGGITPGDSAGLPVTISRSGSYRLTGNLTLPNTSSQGIIITASDVTLDLGGFAISGPGTDGTGDGISGSTPQENIEVRNGTVEGLGRFGLGLIGVNNRVINVRSRRNGLDGIRLGSQGLIRGCTASFNNGSGLMTGPSGSLIGNVSTRNGLVQPSAAGIIVGDGSLVVDNIVSNNTGEGLVTGLSSNVTGNVFHFNSEDGVRSSKGSVIKNNTVRGNGGIGLNMDANTGYVNNVITDNNGGSVGGQGTQLGTNFCDLNTVCP